MEKDLQNYKIRTDLAIDEKIENRENIIIKTNVYDDIKVTNVNVLKKIEEINKKPGNYITIEFDDVTDYDNNKKVEKIFIKELKKIIKNYFNILIVGLGNKATEALIKKHAVCSGYSDALSILLNYLNIKNRKISNNIHVWNYVLIDDTWYHIDVTNDDFGNEISYRFFLVNTDTIKFDKNHNFLTNVYS